MTTIPDAVPARPWRPEDGPKPEVWTWPRGDRPALQVMSAGRWRHAPVLARQNWADGTVRYQVEVDLLGDRRVRIVTYQWPQPGLRAAQASGSEPSTGVDEKHQGAMPTWSAGPDATEAAPGDGSVHPNG